MIFSILIIVWLISILIAICCLSKEEWHYKARSYLRWALFPFSLMLFPRKMGIKSWLLFLLSPFMMLAYFIAFALWIASIMFSDRYGIPKAISYHNCEDLKRVTGVNFPDIVPVDSIWHETLGFSETIIKFVPKETVSPSFYQDLEKACKEDSLCWRKDSLVYYYSIYTDISTDSIHGTDIKEDSPHSYINISIPFSGDTIYVHDGILSGF